MFRKTHLPSRGHPSRSSSVSAFLRLGDIRLRAIRLRAIRLGGIRLGSIRLRGHPSRLHPSQGASVSVPSVSGASVSGASVSGTSVSETVTAPTNDTSGYPSDEKPLKTEGPSVLALRLSDIRLCLPSVPSVSETSLSAFRLGGIRLGSILQFKSSKSTLSSTTGQIN